MKIKIMGVDMPEVSTELFEGMKELLAAKWPAKQPEEGKEEPGAALVAAMLEMEIEPEVIGAVLSSALGYFASMYEQNTDGRGEDALINVATEALTRMQANRAVMFLSNLIEGLNDTIDCDCPDCKPDTPPEGATIN